MGLLLYAVLLFFGARGMALKRGAVFCLVTAAILTVLAIGAIDDFPSCEGIGCNPSVGTLALAFLTNLALSFASFGFGAASKRLVARFKKA